ncbi:MAG: pyridoxamine 5'-phosphate oxidase family protein [Candidatus Delongbacteria bacterium]|nr:pyridoxamine 5'-phosphate oxidase family protein [Candidatus Delongbacteria bacterium]
MSTKEYTLTLEEMEQVLGEEVLGFLGLAGSEGPYVVPLNYSYRKGQLLFHCALQGRKLDILRSNPQVCFTVARQAGVPQRHPEGDPCHGSFDSVICEGVARIVEELVERRQLLDQFNLALQPDAKPITPEDATKCFAVEIRVNRMTCRREQEGTRTFGRHDFTESTPGH